MFPGRLLLCFCFVVPPVQRNSHGNFYYIHLIKQVVSFLCQYNFLYSQVFHSNICPYKSWRFHFIVSIACLFFNQNFNKNLRNFILNHTLDCPLGLQRIQIRFLIFHINFQKVSFHFEYIKAFSKHYYMKSGESL